MKLSELVNLKNKLLQISTIQAQDDIDFLDGKFSAILNLPVHADHRSIILSTIKNISSIEDYLFNIDHNLQQIIDDINTEIDIKTKIFKHRGYTINGFFGSNSTNFATEITDRLLPITNQTKNEIINIIRSRTNWQYPTLEIGPGDGSWTEHLVAADPLYIVDVHPESLELTKNRFNNFYQQRLRTYLTGNHAKKSEFDLSELPSCQFSFIFSWNVFNYFPQHETTLMLSQCFDLMRPGGSMIFSYNNCNLVKCAEFCEIGFRSWMTSEIIEKICKDIGFNIIKNETPEETFSWIEILKPGKLETVKAHQVLGKIINLKT